MTSSDAALPLEKAGGRPLGAPSFFRDRILPVLAVLLAIVAVWYLAAVWLNARGVECPDPSLAREIRALEPAEEVLGLLRAEHGVEV